MKTSLGKLLMLIFLTLSGPSMAQDDSKEYSDIARNLEARLKSIVESDKESDEIRDFSSRILREEFGLQKLEDYWVRKISSCDEQERRRIKASGQLKEEAQIDRLAELRCKQGR